ncbi:MAG: hypothetical protein ACYSWO_29665 [Planctomycetota bacterium]
MANTECPAASPRGERAANDRTFAANPDSEWSSMDLTTLSMEGHEAGGQARQAVGDRYPGRQQHSSWHRAKGAPCHAQLRRGTLDCGRPPWLGANDDVELL